MKEILTNIVQLRTMSPTSIFSWVLAIIMLIVSLVLGLIFPKVFDGTETISEIDPVLRFWSDSQLFLAGPYFHFSWPLRLLGIMALPFLALAFFILNIFGCTAVFYAIGKRIAPQIAERKYAGT